MWSQILGAASLLGLVVLCAELPKVVDAWCERIRGGVQPSAAELDEDGADEVAATAPAPRTAVKPQATKPAVAKVASA